LVVAEGIEHPGDLDQMPPVVAGQGIELGRHEEPEQAQRAGPSDFVLEVRGEALEHS